MIEAPPKNKFTQDRFIQCKNNKSSYLSSEMHTF